MVNAEIEQIISKFVNAVILKGIHIEKVILYGSFASNRAHKDSDIDIAIISSDFGKDRYEEGKKLLQIAWRVDPRLAPIPISLESYKKDTWIPLIYEIREKGIELTKEIRK
ncbi:MAG: hypothetical protein A2149_06810 [Candidatus Schekmanbacteria bacterium RBG_16_38_11]|uniref:Polymerase beta nucleotidyltransferase domain-containing protein n=1 Tax=Candidatus Schekmanbacteria bacterium RBG_16_38_11 TaxID=1817880 RepID=A0A1F7RVV8_9BACT|nr:MAG: hypothetical protein A2149_06810 [Candidatus Schekmanbacteria bacterium RBG_16_38_11]